MLTSVAALGSFCSTDTITFSNSGDFSRASINRLTSAMLRANDIEMQCDPTFFPDIRPKADKVYRFRHHLLEIREEPRPRKVLSSDQTIEESDLAQFCGCFRPVERRLQGRDVTPQRFGFRTYAPLAIANRPRHRRKSHETIGLPHAHGEECNEYKKEGYIDQAVRGKRMCGKIQVKSLHNELHPAPV